MSTIQKVIWSSVVILVGVSYLIGGTALIGEPKVYADQPNTNIQQDTIITIKQVALKYTVSSWLLIEVAKCESSLKNEGVYGDGGRAYGIYQFHKGTFEHFKKLSGMDNLIYKDKEDQIELTAWAFAHGYGYHWTCYKKVLKTR